MTDPSAETTPVADAPPRRRWKRRVGIVLAVLFVLLALLILLLPTLLTSRPVERRVAVLLSERLNRPVKLEGLSLGWRSPLRLERVELPAVAGEAGHRPFLLERVEVPVTLWRALRQGAGVSLEGVEVGRVEVNAVRLPEGDWNLLRLVQSLTDEASTKPDKEKEPGEPFALRLAGLRLRVQAIDVRAIDPEAGLIGGWEAGRLEVIWPGGPQPLTVDVAGDLRLNDGRLPWSIRAKLGRWLDDAGHLTPTAAEVTVSSGGMLHEGQLAGGGFFLHASAEPDTRGVLRVLLPLAKLMAFARQGPLPENMANVSGELDWLTEWRHADDFGTWQLSSRLSAHGLDVELPAMDLPPQEATLTASLIFDARAATMRGVQASLVHAAASGSLAMRELALDRPWDVEGLRAELAVVLEEATALAALTRGGANAPLLTGRAALTVEPIALAPDAQEFEASVTFEPVELHALEPFALANPAFLEEGPLDLAPLGLHARARMRLAGDPRVLRVELIDWDNAILRDWSLCVEGGLDAQHGTIQTTGEVDLAVPLRAWGERLLGTQAPELAGLLGFDIRADAAGVGKATTVGAVALREVTLRLAEQSNAATVPETTLAWELSVDNEAALLEIRSMVLESELLHWTLNGTMTDRFDLETRVSTRLGPLLEFAGDFGPLPAADLDGQVDAHLRLEGTAGDRLNLTVELNGGDDLHVAQAELFHLTGPAAVEAVTEIVWNGDAPSTATVELQRLALGSALDAKGLATIGLGERQAWDVALGAVLDLGSALEVLDPAVLERFDAAVDVVGVLGLDLHARTTVMNGPEGMEFLEPLVVRGEAQTSVDALEWLYGEWDGLVEGFFDERAFRIELNPADPSSLTYADQSATGMELLAGPMSVELGAWSAESALEVGAGEIVFDLAELDIASLGFRQGEFGARVPAAGARGTIRLDRASNGLAVESLEARVGEVIEMKADARFDAESRAWTAAGVAVVRELGAPLAWLRLPDHIMDLLPASRGVVRVEADMAGRLADAEGAGASVQGWFTGEADDVHLTLHGLDVRGLDAVVAARVNEDETGTGALDLSIERISLAGAPFKAIRDVAVTANGSLEGPDALKVTLDRFDVRNYGVAARGHLDLTGLAAVHADTETIGAARWLQHLDVDGRFELDQRLGGISGLHPALLMEGDCRAEVQVRNEPRRGLFLESAATVRRGEVVFSDMVDLRGIDGSWRTRKSLPVRGLIAPGETLAPGRFTIEEALLGPPRRPGLKTRLRRSTVTLRGFDEPFRARLEVRDMMGGNAVADARMTRRDNSPMLEADIQMAGIDAGQLAGLEGRDRREWEINAGGRASWHVRPVALDRALEDLDARIESTRIGRRAFIRLLDALDAEQADPRIQNARTALNFGTPTGALAALDNGLITFRGTLGAPGGLSFPLPIVDRQPLGDILEVTEWDRFDPMFALARGVLLVLLARDREEFAETLTLPGRQP
ncbi:MAG: hypothetical protein KF858_14215 [Candidatus Sumerlaeia bacterium]|nr:hypothetical protein [Candidatus Sumerlaeia bacterium]